MTECPKCSQYFQKVEGLFADFLWCPDCFYYECKHLETCCRTPDMKHVQKGVQLRMQCFNCGAMNSQALKKDTVPDFKSLPVANEQLREKKWEKYHEQQKKFSDWVNNKRLTHFRKEHEEYINSDKWKELRLRILKRDNYLCQGCLIQPATQVHHLTYERFTYECCFDLISVCEDCHTKIHNK